MLNVIHSNCQFLSYVQRLFFEVLGTEIKMAKRNFSDVEKEVLQDLVLKYKATIENKKSDNISLRRKEEIWNVIAEEFNAEGLCERSAKQLKAAYKNIKYRLKKDISNDRLERYKTGGGSSSSKVKESPLMEVLSPQLFSMENEFDSSSSYLENQRNMPQLESSTSKLDSSIDEFCMSELSTSGVLKDSNQDKKTKHGNFVEFKKKKITEFVEMKKQTEHAKQELMVQKAEYYKLKKLKLEKEL